jgi:hypothetical protein
MWQIEGWKKSADWWLVGRRCLKCRINGEYLSLYFEDSVVAVVDVLSIGTADVWKGGKLTPVSELLPDDESI